MKYFNKTETFPKHFLKFSPLLYSKAEKELGYTTRSYSDTIHDEMKTPLAVMQNYDTLFNN